MKSLFRLSLMMIFTAGCRASVVAEIGITNPGSAASWMESLDGGGDRPLPGRMESWVLQSDGAQLYVVSSSETPITGFSLIGALTVNSWSGTIDLSGIGRPPQQVRVMFSIPGAPEPAVMYQIGLREWTLEGGNRDHATYSGIFPSSEERMQQIADAAKAGRLFLEISGMDGGTVISQVRSVPISVPEPGVFGLLGLSLLAVGQRRRR